MKVILTGSIAIDYLMKFPGLFSKHILAEHLDKVSLSFLVHEMARHDGGVGANIAYNLAMLGGKAYLFSTAGQDFPEYGARLQKAGVDVRGVRIIPDKYTASFFCNTDQNNAQIASFYTGAMADSANYSLKEADIDPDDFVMVSPTDPGAMERYIRESAEMGLRMLFDPGQQIVSMNPEVLRLGLDSAYGFFVNEYEFELLQRHTGRSAKEIIERTPLSVVTLGSNGARLCNREAEVVVPAISGLNVQDPTGVGDAFRGAFLRGYMAGLSLQVCGEMGTVMAAACLVENGTQKHAFTLDSFKTAYRVHFDDHGELDLL